MNDVTKPGSASPGLDEAAVRLRAYELWERGGRVHGHDQDNWFAAETNLKQAETAADAPSASISKVAAGTIVDGIHGVTTLAVGAMSAVAGLFGTHATKSEDPPQKAAAHKGGGEPDDVEAPALATEEKAVLLAQDKRIREAKVAAEATKASKPKKPVNQDG